MLLEAAGGRSAISKQAPVPLIAECALLRTKRTAELANRIPSVLGSSPWPTNREPRLARVGPTTPKQFGAKHQTCPHLAVHVPPDSTLEMGAAEMGAAIRCPVVGDFPRGTETAEPLTSTPEPWSPASGWFGQWHGRCSTSELSVRLSPSTRERLL